MLIYYFSLCENSAGIVLLIASRQLFFQTCITKAPLRFVSCCEGNIVDGLFLKRESKKGASHPNMVYKDARGNILFDEFFAERLKKTEARLNHLGISISHGKLLADLTFGFWVKFFDTSSIKVLRGAPLEAFINKPHKKLALVHSHLNAVVTLRNRIAHNEPICFNNTGSICLTTIDSYETNILEALGWLDNDLMHWSRKINFFRPVYNRIAEIV